MAGIFAYTCSCCGKLHEGSPSFSCASPLHYALLSDLDKENKAILTSDLCTIAHGEQTDRFVRVVLEIPIHGVTEPFTWGVWVSLSDSYFERYTSTWGSHDESDSYFGWFSNALPHYPNTVNLKTMVRPRSGGLRPYLELEHTDHPLSVHVHEGLTIEEAQRIAEHVLHGL
jgi:hypothetical protein